MKKPDNIEYGLHDRPPKQIAVLLALQQLSFLSVYMVVSPALARALNLDFEQSLQLISATFLASGIGVMLQAMGRFGIGSGYFCPLQNTSATFGALIIAGMAGGNGAVFGAVGLMGLSQIIFGYIFSKLRGVFNIQIAGLAIMLMGLMLGQRGLGTILSGPDNSGPSINDFYICAGTLIPMIAANVSRFRYLKLFSAFIGLASGTIISFVLGAIPLDHLSEFDPATHNYLPRPDQIAWSLHAESITPVLVSGLFLALHGFGALALAQRFNDADWKSPNMHLIRRGITAEGLTNIIGSFLNAAPITSSGGAVTLGAATGCTSRIVAFWLGGIMIFLAFAPRFVILVDALPDAMLGSAMIFLSCFTTMAGLQIISSRLLDNRKILTLGSGILLGISYEPLKELIHGVIPESFKAFFFSGIGVGVMSAVLLSMVFRVFAHKHEKKIFNAAHSSFDEISSFLQREGRSFGAQAGSVKRAEYATWQAFDILLHHDLLDAAEDENPTICVEAILNEYHFNIVLSYRGILAPLALRPPTQDQLIHDETGVLQMAGYLLRKLADEVESESEHHHCKLTLRFSE